jgi:hypothetical protein
MAPLLRPPINVEELTKRDIDHVNIPEIKPPLAANMRHKTDAPLTPIVLPTVPPIHIGVIVLSTNIHPIETEV